MLCAAAVGGKEREQESVKRRGQGEGAITAFASRLPVGSAKFGPRVGAKVGARVGGLVSPALVGAGVGAAHAPNLSA
jgi:hypothetical protein